jgi:UDP-N-acetylmuramyl pentapeptide synthase
LIELGKASKEVHRKIGGKIGQICDLAIITTKDHFEEIQKGASKKEKIILIENSKEIVNRIKSFLGSGDVVLFEGRVSKNIIEPLKN